MTAVLQARANKVIDRCGEPTRTDWWDDRVDLHYIDVVFVIFADGLLSCRAPSFDALLEVLR